MYKLLPITFFVLLSEMALASSICERNQNQLRSYLSHVSSRVAFQNDGGLFNSGVCWWHARLQRSSTYLVQFMPGQNAPSVPELHKILHSLRVMDETVLIPGYSDFESFSRDYESEIQAMLNEWQMRDGFLNFEWIRGISGRSSLPPADMKSRMDSLFAHYESSPAPVWTMAQIKGVASHALLVLGMKKNAHGYDLTVIDSNHPLKNIPMEYHEGDTSLHATGESYSFVPYVGFQNDFRKISTALKKVCRNKDFDLNIEAVQDGEVEGNSL